MGLLQARPEVLRYERSLFSSDNEEFDGYLATVAGSSREGDKWANQKELQ
jgi:hypothetical protein